MGTRTLLDVFVLICSDPRMLDGFGTAPPIPRDQVCQMLMQAALRNRTLLAEKRWLALTC